MLRPISKRSGPVPVGIDTFNLLLQLAECTRDGLELEAGVRLRVFLGCHLVERFDFGEARPDAEGHRRGDADARAQQRPPRPLRPARRRCSSGTFVGRCPRWSAWVSSTGCAVSRLAPPDSSRCGHASRPPVRATPVSATAESRSGGRRTHREL